jgi:hypothetical protein
MFLFHAGMVTLTSAVPFGTHWQLSRDSGVTARAVSSISSSLSVAAGQVVSPSVTYTWQVAHAHTPPQAWSISTPAASARSIRLPGSPVRP